MCPINYYATGNFFYALTHSSGQFWNVPITVSEFTGTLFDTSDNNVNRYTMSVNHPTSPQRNFAAILYGVDWESRRNPCFYAGNQQGGPIYEVEEPNDSVIEGDYEEYRVSDAFDPQFKYSKFVEGLCAA